MSRPNYMVLFPGGHCIECDSIVSAIQHRRGEGTVYERLGRSTLRKLEHEEALVAACKAALKSFEWANDLLGGESFVPQRKQLREVLAAVEKSEEQLLAAIGEEHPA
jgi:hypothetical protein